VALVIDRDVGDDSNDLDFTAASLKALANCVDAGIESISDAFADDDVPRSVGRVGRVEQAAAKEWNSHRAEVVAGNDPLLR
jgi:hypothetical protein